MNISTVPHRSDREAIGGLKGSNFASATGNVVCDDCRAWRGSERVSGFFSGIARRDAPCEHQSPSEGLR